MCTCGRHLMTDNLPVSRDKYLLRTSTNRGSVRRLGGAGGHDPYSVSVPGASRLPYTRQTGFTVRQVRGG